MTHAHANDTAGDADVTRLQTTWIKFLMSHHMIQKPRNDVTGALTAIRKKTEAFTYDLFKDMKATDKTGQPELFTMPTLHDAWTVARLSLQRSQ